MSGENSLQLRIREFIFQTFPTARKRNLDVNASLLRSGIIDSQGVLEIVNLIEHELGLQLLDEDLTPENFDSIASLASFVEKKRSQVEVSAK